MSAIIARLHCNSSNGKENHAMTKIHTALLVSAALMLATPASAAEFKVFCAKGADVEHSLQTGTDGRPVTLLPTADIVAVNCRVDNQTVHRLRGIDGVTFKNVDAINNFLSQTRSMFDKPKTANVGAPNR